MTFLFLKSCLFEILWENVVQPTQMTIRRMCNSWWVLRAFRIFMKFDMRIFFGEKKSVQKIQIPFKSTNNNRYFTCRPIYIFDHNSLSSAYSEKCFRRKLYRKSKHILCSVNFSLENRAIYEITWKNIVERGRSQMAIWRMRIAWWILKATDTHLACVIFMGFPMQHCLHERASMFRYTYIDWLVG